MITLRIAKDILRNGDRLYTADQVREILEAAAVIAEGYPKYGESAAEEIREMKEQVK